MNPHEVRVVNSSPVADFPLTLVNARIIGNLNIAFAQGQMDPMYKLKSTLWSYFEQKPIFYGK